MNRILRTNIYLYIILCFSVLVQTSFKRHTAFFPDVILLMVVFVSIFRGSIEGARFGLVAGFLRGCFSVGTFPVDIFLFPVVGMISSLFPKMVYRDKPVAQVFISVAAIFFVIAVHVIYINLASSSNVGIPFIFLNSWRTITATIVTAPILFAVLRVVLNVQE